MRIVSVALALAVSLAASPLLAERSLEPVSTPAGIRSLILEVRSRRPAPRQVLHGFSITRPAPWHCGQVCAMLKMPREVITWPRPPHAGQLRVCDPGSAPEP